MQSSIAQHPNCSPSVRCRISSAAAFLGLSLLLAFPCLLRADTPNFDLQGPTIEMTVSRDGKKLPIANVSDLHAGDRLWIHPVFPSDQAVHYLLVVAFLKGPTNPPPENWFTRVETWTKQARQEGAVVTVPAEAQQAILFLAPETGGDFSTLRNTVIGRPGVFIRASKDLEQASLDRTRLDKYLDEVRKTSDQNPADLKKNTALLAQTLRIKVNEDCFNRPTEQQAYCLTANSNGLVIDDAHSQSLVAQITSGPSSDLISALGSSPAARGGYYSPYVGAIVDAARLMSTLHTAAYQYIPALSPPNKDTLNLRLNAPPSFHNPKSVLVVGLPSVAQSPLPRCMPRNPSRLSAWRSRLSSYSLKARRWSSPPPLPTTSFFASSPKTPLPSIFPPSPTPRAAASSSTPPNFTALLSPRKRSAPCTATGASRPSTVPRSNFASLIPAIGPSPPPTPPPSSLDGTPIFACNPIAPRVSKKCCSKIRTVKNSNLRGKPPAPTNSKLTCR